MSIRIESFRMMSADERTEETAGMGEPFIPISYRNREHASTVAGAFDFTRRSSMEGPSHRSAEPPQSPRLEPLPDSPPTLMPS
jgi:hypothetical protein